MPTETVNQSKQEAAPPSFDVRSQPWIPVARADGSVVELGLGDALKQAHQLRAVIDAMPTVEFGLYRLLTAFVLDIFQLSNSSQLQELMAAGQLDAAAIDAYFSRHDDRFDLFHARYPFLQTGGMESEGQKPLAGLLPTVPSGTNAGHFHHAHEAEFGVSVPAAARLLTTIAPFMTAGGAGLSPSINGAPPWYVLLSRPGDTLFTTLCLNCYAQNLQRATPGPPCWASDNPVQAQEYKRASLLQSLTWQPRRIQLLPEKGGICALTGQNAPVLVRHMKFAAGATTRFEWRDPAIAYKEDDKSVTPIRPQENKEVWRDTGPLALLEENDSYVSAKNNFRYERPALISQYAQHFAKGKGSKPRLHLTLYGMRTDLKMKVFEWQREELSLPTELILNGPFHGEAQRAMDQAGDVAFCLYAAIKKAYPREGKGNNAAFQGRIADAQRRYWQQLRPHYEIFLEKLSVTAPDYEAGIKALRDEWGEQERKAGRGAFEEAIADLDASREDILRVQVLARKEFFNRLSRLFEPPEAKAARLQGKKVTGKSTKGVPASAAT